MKKKNLNFLLALLAALALVFAGACSDGSDDDGSGSGSGNENSSPSSSNDSPSGNDEPTVTYTTYTYPGDESTDHDGNSTYLGPVSLTFADFGDGGTSVDISVQYVTCGTAGDKKGEGGQSACSDGSASCTLYRWSSNSATYSYTAGTAGGSDTVTVTLPESNDSPAVSGAYLTLTVGTGDDSGKLTLTEAKTSSDGDLSGYTVKGNDGSNDDETGCDILKSDSTTGALEANSSEFELDE